MTNEQQFYQELGRVPEVPDGLYGLASGKIRRQAVLVRAVLAAAALFIVAAGTTGVLIVNKGNRQVLSVEAADELQMVHNYLTSRDLDKEYESYVLYEGN